jgi:hypothetical protein
MALAEAGQEDPYSDYDERACDFLKGKTKFNDSCIEEAENRILAVTATTKRGEFEP